MQTTQHNVATKKATIHFLGERLFEDKIPNNIQGIMLDFEEPVSLEAIWCFCQNHNPDYSIFETRSLMVGDVIEIENGDKYEVSFMGFEKIEA